MSLMLFTICRVLFTKNSFDFKGMFKAEISHNHNSECSTQAVYIAANPRQHITVSEPKGTDTQR